MQALRSKQALEIHTRMQARGVFQFATKGGNQKPRDPIEEAEAKQRHDQQIQEDWGTAGAAERQRRGLVSCDDQRSGGRV